MHGAGAKAVHNISFFLSFLEVEWWTLVQLQLCLVIDTMPYHPRAVFLLDSLHCCQWLLSHYLSMHAHHPRPLVSHGVPSRASWRLLRNGGCAQCTKFPQ
jgi:hypothetical protein